MKRQIAYIGTLAALLHLGAAVGQAQNTAYGSGALSRNGGGGNTAVGHSALYSNTSGIHNSAFGHAALYSNTSGNFNTASGLEALAYNTTGHSNTAVGYGALRATSTSHGNTAVGINALRANTTGHSNTAFGSAALQSIITGSDNIALGESAGLNLTTGGNNIYLGHRGMPTESNIIRLGDPATHTQTYLAGTVHASTVVITSDARLKTNITPLTNVLEKVKQLRGVSYDWTDEYKAVNRGTERREIGVLAQDVEAVFPELVTTWGEGHKAVEYGKLSGVLVEAIKELQATTETQLATQEAHIAALRAQVEALASGGAMQRSAIEWGAGAPFVGGFVLAGLAILRRRHTSSDH